MEHTPDSSKHFLFVKNSWNIFCFIEGAALLKCYSQTAISLTEIRAFH